MQAEPLQPINMTTMKMRLLKNWNCIETFWARWKIPVKCNFTSYVAFLQSSSASAKCLHNQTSACMCPRCLLDFQHMS